MSFFSRVWDSITNIAHKLATAFERLLGAVEAVVPALGVGAATIALAGFTPACALAGGAIGGAAGLAIAGELTNNDTVSTISWLGATALGMVLGAKFGGPVFVLMGGVLIMLAVAKFGGVLMFLNLGQCAKHHEQSIRAWGEARGFAPPTYAEA